MPLKPKVLIAEDDAGVREIIRTRLQAAGYDVQVARDGRAALVVVGQWRPAAMVLDINMPGLDGFGVLAALAEQAEAPPRVLVLTARQSAGDVKRAIELGAKDYLNKPFSEGQLLSRVARLLRKPEPRVADAEVLL